MRNLVLEVSHNLFCRRYCFGLASDSLFLNHLIVPQLLLCGSQTTNQILHQNLGCAGLGELTVPGSLLSLLLCVGSHPSWLLVDAYHLMIVLSMSLCCVSEKPVLVWFLQPEGNLEMTPFTRSQRQLGSGPPWGTPSMRPLGLGFVDKSILLHSLFEHVIWITGYVLLVRHGNISLAFGLGVILVGVLTHQVKDTVIVIVLCVATLQLHIGDPCSLTDLLKQLIFVGNIRRIQGRWEYELIFANSAAIVRVKLEDITDVDWILARLIVKEYLLWSPTECLLWRALKDLLGQQVHGQVEVPLSM